MATYVALWIVLLVVSAVIVHQRRSRHVQLPQATRLPPGPPGRPILGNLLDIPPKHSWLTFKSWADTYGPLIWITIMGRNMIIISNEKIANDLLRERGTLYSSREQLPMAAELMSRNLRPLLLPYNELWRRGRKLMHNLTMSTAATSYQPIQLYESERLLIDLIKIPSDYETLFERYAGNVIMQLAFGKTPGPVTEDFVRRALEVVHTVERVASPGAYLVDTFPALMYLPSWLAPFKREAEMLHERELSFFRQLQNDVRMEMASGKSKDSFTKIFLEKQPEYKLSDDEGAYVIGTLFEAGSGTTAAAMMSFCLAMCHYPTWQTKLQEEVDGVVGEDRMPDFEDMPSLPTVRAVAKEVLRWRPVTAGGVPHQLIKDDIYDGYFFPAGTVVHANQWAIHRDPTLYPDPETFNPARWLSDEYPTFRGPLDKYPNLQNFSAFGFGRRICPGLNIAERSLYLLIARIGWTCEISKRAGVEVPWYDYTSGFNVQPKKFVFDLRARDETRWEVLEGAWKLRESRNMI